MAQVRFGRMRFLAKTIMSSPAVMLVYSPLLVAQTVVGVAVPFATGRFIDALIDKTAAVGSFVVLAVLLLVRAIMTPCLQRFVMSRSRSVELKLQERVLDAVMHFHPSKLSSFANGELVAKLTRDAYAVGGFVSGLYPRILVAIITMLAAGYALYSRSAALGVFFVAFIPLAILLFYPFSRLFARKSHCVRQKSDDSFATLFDFFQSLPFLRTMDAGHRFADSSRDALCALRDGNCDMDHVAIVFSSILGLVLVVGEIAVLGIAGIFAAKDLIHVGDVVVYQMLFFTAMQAVQGIVSLIPEAAFLREGVDSLGEILSHDPSRRGEKKIRSIEKIEFRNVTFSYPGTEANPIVKDFSATFHVGKSIALIGANGTGKTTLLKLATAALEPQSGEVLINGVPLQLIDESIFRRELGIVFQDSLLVSGTVRDNITLRDPMFTAEDVEKAVSTSGLEAMIKKLPDGLNTRLGMRGQALSGGELQRLAIARALIRNPSVLVLDEATNHLDKDARISFGGILRRLAKDRIILFVAHDKSVADLCDEKLSVDSQECCDRRVPVAINKRNKTKENKNNDT